MPSAEELHSKISFTHLDIICRIPIHVEQNQMIRAHQIKTGSTGSCTQQQDTWEKMRNKWSREKRPSSTEHQTRSKFNIWKDRKSCLIRLKQLGKTCKLKFNLKYVYEYLVHLRFTRQFILSCLLFRQSQPSKRRHMVSDSYFMQQVVYRRMTMANWFPWLMCFQCSNDTKNRFIRI